MYSDASSTNGLQMLSFSFLSGAFCRPPNLLRELNWSNNWSERSWQTLQAWGLHGANQEYLLRCMRVSVQRGWPETIFLDKDALKFWQECIPSYRTFSTACAVCPAWCQHADPKTLAEHAAANQGRPCGWVHPSHFSKPWHWPECFALTWACVQCRQSDW